MIRGCVGDNYEFSSQDCSEQDNCLLCSDGDNCNGKSVEREKCISSAYNSAQPSPLSDLISIECPLYPKRLGCYHLLEKSSNIVRKGCAKSLTKRDRLNCEQRKNCEICRWNDCNNRDGFLKKECYFCSGYVNPIANPKDCVSLNGFNVTVSCQDRNDKCVIGIDADGITHRRCSTDVNEDKKMFPNGYELCNGNLCNDDFLPKNRLHCHQCSDDGNCDYITTKVPSEVCQYYDGDDQCFTYTSKGKIMINLFKSNGF